MRPILAVAILAASVLGAPVLAQPSPSFKQPAEYPPASYAGRQYVDSTGCVFIRAGFDGQVTWVPRVSSGRRQLCGFAPSLAARAEAPAQAAAPERVTAAASAAPVARPASPARAAVPARTVRPAAPRLAAPAAPPAAPRAVPRAVPAGAPQRATALQIGRGLARPVPAAPAIAPPPGYRAAWSDDRLNPNRGKQTLTGAMQTGLIWTQTVPRRLIDRSTGEEVTGKLRLLIYPYTDYDRQLADLRGGEVVVVQLADGLRQAVRRDRLRVNAQGQTVLMSSKSPGRTRLSSKSEPSAAVARTRRTATSTVHSTASAPAASYVQIGAFGVASNADRAAGRLRALGLPARIGRSGGLQVVMAGPFRAPGEARAVLVQLRRAGFGDAILR